MKIFKFTMIACFVATGFTAVAQDNAKHTDRKDQKEKVMDALELSDDQRSEIDALRAEMKEKLDGLKADESLEGEAKKAEFKAIKQEKKEAFNEILTEEQRSKLEAMKAEKKAQKRDITPEDAAQKQTDKMKEVLELTTEQEQQVYELNLKVANKIDVIKNDDAMTDEKKKEFIKGNKEDKRRALEAILTAEQLTEWDAYLASKKKLKGGSKKSQPATHD